MQERYSNENNDEYRDIYYMYVKESIKDYNNWLSVEMLESDSDKLLMQKANDLKYYNKLVKHIEKYFKLKKNNDIIHNYLKNEESQNHKHIKNHYKTNKFGINEINEMLYIIADWDVLFHYKKKKGTTRKYLRYAKLYDLFSERNLNYFEDLENFEDFEDLEDFENFVESLYEEEERSSDNEVILESNEYFLN